MRSIKELQEQLVTIGSVAPPVMASRENGIIVLKHYRFHKQLSIELYNAPTTQAGKLKNPLVPVNPLEAALKTKNAEELRFYTAVSRFQNNPTALKSPSDIEALKQVLKNPLGLRLFYHDPEFSENVVAGSLHEVKIGAPIKDLTLLVVKDGQDYEIHPQLNIEGKNVSFHDITLLYEYFAFANDSIHLLARFPLLKPFRFFKQQPLGRMRIAGSRFKEFQDGILNLLGDAVTINYSFVTEGTEQQLEETGITAPSEKLIYLSDLDNYIMINPVMRYGSIEIPVLSKRVIYARDGEGRPFTLTRDDDAETRFIALLLKQHHDFEEQLDTDLTYFYLHRHRFLDEDWFLKAFDEWQSQGITILGFNQLKGNKINGNKAKVTIQVTSGLNWFNTLVDVRFGKKKASLKELVASVRNKKKFVQLDDGSLGILPQEWLKKFEEYFNAAEVEGELLQTPRVNFDAIRKLYKDEELDAQVLSEINEYERMGAGLDGYVTPPVPKELKAELREYQKQGLAWLNLLDHYNFGGCLADDMGLGKTVQVIAFILGQRERVARNTNLIVVPTSLIFNWEAEIKKFAPSIKLMTLYGSGRIKQMKDLDQHEVVLTSYGTLLLDINYLRNYTFNYVFLDESQNIKNVESQRYDTVMRLKARNRIAITGTPIENNTLDLFAQLSFACPGLLGSKQSFRDLFSIPIDKFKNSKRAVELQNKVSPFVLRRTKKEVASELPEKTEMILYCPMSEAQRNVYDANEKEVRDFIAGLSEDELPKSSMHVLRGLTRLRQICDSPLLLEDEKLFGEGSSKIEALVEQVENKAPEHKILVFSQFVSMLDLIKKEFDARGIVYEYLTGSTKNREDVVNHFQDDPTVRVFLISLKAGGTGLNLTRADYVYLVDPWWNPAVESQAIDRSYRIGQEKHVVAVRLICPDTVEEKMMKLQAEKRGLFEGVIGKAEWLSLFGA